MIILIETSARFGKTTIARHLGVNLENTIVIDEPRIDSEDFFIDFLSNMKNLSKTGNVIITDAGNLTYFKENIIDHIDVLIVSKINSKPVVERLNQDAFNIYGLHFGEVIIDVFNEDISDEIVDFIENALKMLNFKCFILKHQDQGHIKTNAENIVIEFKHP